MRKRSSPQKFLEYLEINKNLFAGAVSQDEIDTVFEVINGDLNLQDNKQAINYILKNDNGIKSLKGVEVLGFSAENLPIINLNNDNSNCFIVFNFTEIRKFCLAELWTAYQNGNLLGCEISDEVYKRLELANTKKTLSSFLYETATDHFISEIQILLKEVGVLQLDSSNWLWVGENKNEAIQWVHESSLTNFVSCLIINNYKSEV